QQFDSARTTSSVADLNSLQTKFQAVAGAGGKHAEEARQIADMEIPKVLTDIDARNKRDQQEKLWSQLVADYKTALDVDNRTARQSIKDRLSPYLNGSHSQEAQQYVKRLDDLMKAEPPKTTPPVESSRASDDADIHQIFNKLSDAFSSRSVADLTNLLAQVDRVTLDNYRTAFTSKDLKSVSRKYEVSTLNIAGDNATASGIWTGVHSKNGHLVMNDQVKWSANLRRMGGRWVITKLE